MTFTTNRLIPPAALCFCIGLTTACSEKSTCTRPNILWIVADDLGPDLGCYGTPEIYTPHLDRLAAEGVRYTHVFTVAAVSSVSRSALITGMYPVSIHCHQHRTQFQSALPDSIKPITEYFRQAGYYVSNGNARNKDRFGKTDYNFMHSVDSLYDGPDWSGRKKGQPFFAQIQISYPHRPFIRDPEHPVNPEKVSIPPFYPDHPITRKDWALYLETVQAVDRQVGEILDRLEKEGLAENTVLFFFGDQGQPHVRAKQFMYEEGTHTPLLVRWPAQLAPHTVCDDLVSNMDLGAQALDIAGIPLPPSMHGRPFIGKHAKKRKYVFSMRDRRDETTDRIRAVRSERYRYIRNFYPGLPYTQPNAYKKFHYPVLTLMRLLYQKGQLPEEQKAFMKETRPAEELYDLQNDPFELTNLAENPFYKEKKEELSKVLDEWLSRYDTAVYPEDEREINYAKQLMEKNFGKWMQTAGLPVDISDEDFLEWWMDQLGI